MEYKFDLIDGIDGPWAIICGDCGSANLEFDVSYESVGGNTTESSRVEITLDNPHCKDCGSRDTEQVSAYTMHRMISRVFILKLAASVQDNSYTLGRYAAQVLKKGW
jgi:hypothetical protein